MGNLPTIQTANHNMNKLNNIKLIGIHQCVFKPHWERGDTMGVSMIERLVCKLCGNYAPR